MNLESLVDELGPRLLRRVLGSMGDPPVAVRLWDGRTVGADAGRAVGTLVIRDRGALAHLLADPQLAFGDLVVEGRLGIEGDLVRLLTVLHASGGPEGLLGRLASLVSLPGRIATGRRRAAGNARRHYDVGNEFYRLWLDERMLYTCAYFPSPEDGLEDAQLAKMDHVCRKVALRPGDTVLEAGSGWGSLALHMARYYGCRVRALNVSEEQVRYAREQAEKEGLSDRVEFVVDDYRNASGCYDAFVSVGMLEHVGPSHCATLGRVIDRVLAPDGRGLIHSIGRSRPMRLNRWIAKRVFPNARPPSLAEMMRVFEPNGLVVLDVENLRRHYALTSLHWLRRFEAARARAVELVGEELARTWHLYLAGTVASFEASTLELFQIVFTRVGNDAIPWTRAHLYTGEEAHFGGGGGAGAVGAAGGAGSAGGEAPA